MDFNVKSTTVTDFGFQFHIAPKREETTYLPSFDTESKNIHNDLKKLLKYSPFFQTHICAGPDFLHILQSKQHMALDRTQRQIGESCCLPRSQPSKRFAKTKTTLLLLLCFRNAVLSHTMLLVIP